jgi:limonene-1,2-epoxide hydrolase
MEHGAPRAAAEEDPLPQPRPSNREIVHALWNALYRKDWAGVAARIDEHGLYEDVPAPDAGAVGPENVVKRLRLGLDPVQRFEHEIHRVVAEGDSVVIEHTETWHFETGEKIVNDFVTIHELRDGKVTLWRDYWDLNTMMSQAPKWWIERLAQFSEADFT